MTFEAHASLTATSTLVGVFHDTSAWPLVRMRFNGNFSGQDLARHLAELEKYLDRRERWVPAFDLRDTRVITPNERKDYAELMKRRGFEVKERVPRCALITDSALHRGALTALTWLVPLPFDVKFFPQPEAAERWLREAL